MKKLKYQCQENVGIKGWKTLKIQRYRKKKMRENGEKCRKYVCILKCWKCQMWPKQQKKIVNIKIEKVAEMMPMPET